MKGKIGVGYRIFKDVFIGLTLNRGHVINDFVVIEQKVSEFLY